MLIIYYQQYINTLINRMQIDSIEKTYFGIKRNAAPHINTNCTITNLLKKQIVRKSEDSEFTNAYDYDVPQSNTIKSQPKKMHRRMLSENCPVDVSKYIEKQNYAQAKRITQIQEDIIQKANYFLNDHLYVGQTRKLNKLSLGDMDKFPDSNSTNCLQRMSIVKQKMCSKIKEKKIKEGKLQNNILSVDDSTTLSSQNKINYETLQSIDQFSTLSNRRELAEIQKKLSRVKFEELYNKERRQITNRVFSKMGREKAASISKNLMNQTKSIPRPQGSNKLR